MQRFVRIGVLVAALVGITSEAHAQPVRNRTSILIDSSGSMLLTPEIITVAESCVATGWNGCISSGNPSVAQEECNACMAKTIRVSPTCATNFTSTCRAIYGDCWRSINGGTAPACGQTLGVTEGVTTRGDGTALTPGCDVDGDALANDSRLFQAKEALHDVVAAFGEVEFALWRYAQVEGGQGCVTDLDCPDTPGGQSRLTCETIGGVGRCALDATILGSAMGQCSPFTWNGAESSFSCAECSDVASERLVCEAYALGAIRTGGTSPLAGTVNCALPTANHPFTLNQGAFITGSVCDPTGAERLVDFPPSGLDDNRSLINAYIDHQQPNLGTDVEISASGGTPLAAALRDMRAALLASAQADTRTPCRKHQVIVLVDGGEICETVAAAVNAAATFQNLSFTNAAGVSVADYDVPVYVVGFAICPTAQPNCQTRIDLDAIAAAGGTNQAILVRTQQEIQTALSQLVAGSIVSELCNDADDDCDGLIDEDFAAKGSSCSAGVGACVGSGQFVCSASQLDLSCDAVPGTPTGEVCNGVDDDCDGLVDDGIDCPVCTPNCPACGDGIDNDGDLLVDFPADPGCAAATGALEDPECDDDLDNDADGQIDFPADPDCVSSADPIELPEPTGALPELVGAGALWLMRRRSWLRSRSRPAVGCRGTLGGP